MPKPTRKNKLLIADEQLDREDYDEQEETEVEPELEEEDSGHYAEDQNLDDVEDELALIEEEQRVPGSSKLKLSKGGKPGKTEKQIDWEPSNTLKAPKKRPGMTQRWIRYSLHNEDDPKNWTRAMRDGWSPRKISTLPEGHNEPTIQHGKLGTLISVGDLVLCEMPIERFLARKRYFQAKYDRQLAAIQKRPINAAEQLGGPPIQVASKKSVTYGRRKASRTSEE